MKQGEPNKKKEPNKQKKGTLSRRGLIKAIAVIAVVLSLLYVCSELVLPKILDKSRERNKSTDETYKVSRFFYDEEKITSADIAEYEKQVRDIYYKDKDGVEMPITLESATESGDADKILFANYIEAVKNGDNIAYAACFSEVYDSENGLDRFAAGEEFPPQRIYDIHIEMLDTLYDEESGITRGLFDVRYRIYKNSGNFRIDMEDDTAPLLFYTEQKDGKTLICDVAYRYGS